jgi:hypothetical protein
MKSFFRVIFLNSSCKGKKKFGEFRIFASKKLKIEANSLHIPIIWSSDMLCTTQA